MKRNLLFFYIRRPVNRSAVTIAKFKRYTKYDVSYKCIVVKFSKGSRMMINTVLLLSTDVVSRESISHQVFHPLSRNTVLMAGVSVVIKHWSSVMVSMLFDYEEARANLLRARTELSLPLMPIAIRIVQGSPYT